MGTHGTDQDFVQRMLTAPDVRRSRRSLYSFGGSQTFRSRSRVLSIGLLLWFTITAHPDPTLPKNAQRNILSLPSYNEMPVAFADF